MGRSGSRGSGNRGSSSRGSRSRSRDGDDGAVGCCYGLSSQCATDDKATCDRLADTKGCEWEHGATDCSAMWVTPAPVTSSPTTSDPSTPMTPAPTGDPTDDPTVDPTMDWMGLTMDTDNMEMN